MAINLVHQSELSFGQNLPITMRLVSVSLSTFLITFTIFINKKLVSSAGADILVLVVVEILSLRSTSLDTF
jgi:hypothetical protein